MVCSFQGNFPLVLESLVGKDHSQSCALFYDVDVKFFTHIKHKHAASFPFVGTVSSRASLAAILAKLKSLENASKQNSTCSVFLMESLNVFKQFIGKSYLQTRHFT